MSVSSLSSQAEVQYQPPSILSYTKQKLSLSPAPAPPDLSPSQNKSLPESPPPSPKSQSRTTQAISSLVWNIEGMKRNIFSRKNYIDSAKADFIFISEPQIFRSDLPACTYPCKDEYYVELNSEDKLDEEASMTKSKAYGGTLLMWKKSLDQYISVFPSPSTSFLPIVYSPPGSPVSAHIALYLPTSGKESDFLEQIILLSNCIDEMTEKYEDCLVFLRGDANVNNNNKPRSEIFSNFLSKHNLAQAPILHKTYHHFLGGGSFDSNIDIVAYPSHAPYREEIVRIFCKHEFPDIDSHHDIILSSVDLPVTAYITPELDLITAPKFDHTRYKIAWSEDGIEKFKEEVVPLLSD